MFWKFNPFRRPTQYYFPNDASPISPDFLESRYSFKYNCIIYIRNLRCFYRYMQRKIRFIYSTSIYSTKISYLFINCLQPIEKLMLQTNSCYPPNRALTAGYIIFLFALRGSSNLYFITPLWAYHVRASLMKRYIDKSKGLVYSMTNC